MPAPKIPVTITLLCKPGYCTRLPKNLLSIAFRLMTCTCIGFLVLSTTCRVYIPRLVPQHLWVLWNYN